jgi:outer membrane protein assembly factor BamB
MGVVAVLVAMALAAAAFASRHRRTVAAPAPASSRPRDATSSIPSSPIAPHGLGAGPPPPPGDAPAPSPGVVQMLHGDARHTDRAVGRAPRSAPTLVWSHDVSGPVEAQITTSSDEQTLYVASLGGSLSALARADGVERWTLSLGDRAYATPCVARDGTIYVGSDSKKLVAVSPEGKVKWSLLTEGDADTGPVVAGDDVVVFAAGRTVYAVTPFGHVKWRFAAKRKVFTSPAIGRSGRVFFGSQDHHAYAISGEGALVWSVDLGADVDGAPAVGDDGAVFFGTDGDEIVRLDPDAGGVVWRTNVGGYVRGVLSVTRGGDVLAGVYGPTPREVRLRADDGSVIGQFAIQGTGAREFGVHGGALEDDTGALLFGAQDDVVYAVGETSELLWRFPTGGDVDAPVTLLTDGSVVVGSDDGRVYLLRAM